MLPAELPNAGLTIPHIFLMTCHRQAFPSRGPLEPALPSWAPCTAPHGVHSYGALFFSSLHQLSCGLPATSIEV